MKNRRHLILIGAIAELVVILDQVSKALVTSRIAPGEVVDVLGPLRFTLSHNDGIAFGLAGGNLVFVLLMAVVALIALGAFVASAPARWPTAVAGGLILGGAVGNLVDRVRLGHVTDFILLPSWPAFNLADAAITIGVVVLIWNLFTDRDQSAKPRDPFSGAESDLPFDENPRDLP